ncbi:putative membrane protein [Corynebacterium glutamicum ATCC 13032]|nr:putative membrane protein [Corynebacterium glutamicum ATCC 13032]
MNPRCARTCLHTAHSTTQKEPFTMLNALNAVLDVVESAQGLVFVVITASLLTLAVIYIKNYPHAPQPATQHTTDQPTVPEPLQILDNPAQTTAAGLRHDLHSDLYAEEKSA